VSKRRNGGAAETNCANGQDQKSENLGEETFHLLQTLDVKITFPIHGTAIGSLTAAGRDCDSNRKKCRARHFGENRTPSHCRFVEALF
jgi:hypothetical protein